MSVELKLDSEARHPQHIKVQIWFVRIDEMLKKSEKRA